MGGWTGGHVGNAWGVFSRLVCCMGVYWCQNCCWFDLLPGIKRYPLDMSCLRIQIVSV